MPSPGEDVQAWSKTAASNSNADPLINWAEGQPRASVNNSARSMLAAHAKDRDLKNGSITTGGSANAQTFTSGVGYTAPIPTGLTVRLKIGVTNTSATTLNMDSIGAVAIKDQSGNDIGANALFLGRYVDLLYNGTNWILISASAAAAPFDALAYSGLQVNGSTEVSQFSGTAAVSIGTTPTYILDAWSSAKNGTMVASGQQVADAPPGYTNSLKVTVGTAQVTLGIGNFTYISTLIEAYRTSRLQFGTANAQPVSIAFWSKIHRTGPYSGALKSIDSNRSYPFLFTQNVADTWEFKTVTVPGDTTGIWPGNTAGTGLVLAFCIGSGNTFLGAANTWVTGNLLGVTGTTNGVTATSDTFQITGVVILPGVDLPAASRAPFIMRPFTDEIETSQRYYAKSYDYGTVPGTATMVGAIGLTAMVYSATQVGGLGSGFRFPRRMRAAPTVSIYDVAGTGGGMSLRFSGSGSTFPIGGSLFQIGETGVQAVVSASGVGGLTPGDAVELVFSYVADARLP